MLKTDADAKTLLQAFGNVPMPNQNLGDAEMRQYIKYFHWADAQPAGAAKAAGAH
jgi:nitrite reductase (NO-forming)